MLPLPDSARVACWLNAWLRAGASTDDVIAAVKGQRASVTFAGLDAAPLSPALMLGTLRSLSVSRVSVALPVHGDPVGLAGPPAFNAEAYDAGEAIVLHGAGQGLVPRSAGGATQWRAFPADVPAYLPDVASADRELRNALRVAADELARLDVAAWEPEVADELMNLRSPATFDGPTTFASPAAATTALSAARCLKIVDLAGRDHGGALSAHEATRRRDALTPLAGAARAAVVAACSAVDGR